VKSLLLETSHPALTVSLLKGKCLRRQRPFFNGCVLIAQPITTKAKDSAGAEQKRDKDPLLEEIEIE